MQFPFLRLPTVYHWGTLNPIHRGHQWKSSYEGSSLSVSLCPDAWRRIAKLGGNPLHSLERQDALYLDYLGLGEDHIRAITEWGIAAGLAVEEPRWRGWTYDTEDEVWRYGDYKTKREANTETYFAWGAVNGASDLASILKEMELELPEGVRSIVERVTILALTERGQARAAGYGDTDAHDIVAGFFTEDVLRQENPDVVGIWWQEDYEPYSNSAPRGAIFSSLIPEFRTSELDAVEEDEILLEDMPDPEEVEFTSSLPWANAGVPRL